MNKKHKNYNYFLELKNSFYQIRPIFDGEPGWEDYREAMSAYKKLYFKKLSTEDFDRQCDYLFKAITKLDQLPKTSNKS